MSERASSHGLRVFTSLHETIARTGGWTAIGFSALLGAFCALGFAPFHITPALLVSFTALVWLLDGARGRRRWGLSMFVRGWGFGFGFFLVGMYWTALPFLVEPEKHAIFIWMPLIALPGGMALIWGAACALAGAFWSASPSRVFMFAFFMGAAELTRGVLFGGFPWNLAGTTWVPGGAVSQLASVGGIYWLTLLTVFMAAAPAALVDTRETRAVLGRAGPALIAVAIVAFGFAWGSQRLAEQTVMTERTVLLIDAGVPQADKFKENGEPVLARYAGLLRDVPSEPGDIVILPEGALPFDLLRSNTALDIISAFLGPRTLVIGTARQSAIENDVVFYNSLAVFRAGESSADLVALYDKHRLVPFGELPAAKIIPFGELISGILPGAIQRMAKSGFEPGPDPTVLLPDGIMPPMIPLICYEGLFPEMVRKASPQRQSAEWIVVISNDAWFGGGLGPAQHYAQNRYRAIESGLPMARVATRGVTAVIDAYGRETAQGSEVRGDPQGWRSSVVRAPLPAAIGQTPYQRFGESFFWISLVVTAGLAFLTWRR
ncbi:MAG: apolipoprotein N-acyltransferase [Pseudomonadota bacterium]